MTGPTGQDPGTTFVPSNRPVVRFVAVFAVVGGVASLAWWLGLFAARIDIAVADEFAPTESSGVAVVTLHNRAPLDANVGSITLASRQDDRNLEPPVRILEAHTGRTTVIPSGESARFTIRYAVDCTGERSANSERGYSTPSLRVRAFVEGAMGGGRLAPAHEVLLAGACGEPRYDE